MILIPTASRRKASNEALIFAAAAMAQTAKDIRGPSPQVAVENEPPPKLIVDPPLAEPLSRGLAKARSTSPRASATSM